MSHSKKLQLEILDTKELPGIPGASGIACTRGYSYVIGDNSPFLFKLDEEMNVLSKTPIYSQDNLVGDQIIKKLKPDFEALELVAENELLAFGSGSKSPQRDLLVRVLLTPEGESERIEHYNLTPFYAELKQMEVMRGGELNIEAVAFHEGRLYLFNRGLNILFVFRYDEFIRFMEEGPFPGVQILQPNLPRIRNLQAGFSGATIDPETETLIFTASVEDTDNAYDDGEVLGSFIGVVSLSLLNEGSAYRYIPVGGEEDPVKVESVAILEKLALNEALLLLTTDSDGDKSLMIKTRLKW